MKILTITPLPAEAAFHSLPDCSAHLLFPPEQAILWLPGFEGEEEPYCTYNEFRAHLAAVDMRRYNHQPERDENGVPFVPPYPVSSETFISWHTHVSPPFPYHPVPILRPLSPGELDELSQLVVKLIDRKQATSSSALHLLTNLHKAAIVAGLAELGLLGTCPEPAAGRQSTLQARQWPHSA